MLFKNATALLAKADVSAEDMNNAETMYFENIKGVVDADPGMKSSVSGFYVALGVGMDADLKVIAEGHLRATGNVLTEQQMAGKINSWVQDRIPHLKQWLAELEKTDVMGVYGRLRFDPKSHQVIPAKDPKEGVVGSILQWQDEKRVVVYPKSIATGTIQLPPWMKK